MRYIAAVLVVFMGGFAIMVLEIVGARFLAKDFGGSFYVWVSQIGVVLTALAIGYYGGGAMADRFRRARFLGLMLIPAGVFTFCIPEFGDAILDAIMTRHPVDQEIPLVWQKLDPALGSATVFLLPCSVLAALCPYMIRLTTRHIGQVGRISGGIYAASTVGSIAGVFVSGYVLIDQLNLSTILRGTGAVIGLLGLVCFPLDRWMKPSVE